MKAVRLIIYVVIVFVSITVSCSKHEEQDADADDDIKMRVDALRSMPYLDYSEKKAEGKNGIVKYDKKKSYPGYNLYDTRKLCLAELMDENGDILRTWQDSSFKIWQDFELLPDGTFLVLGKKRKGEGTGLKDRAIAVFSWEGKKIREIKCLAHHEIHYTPGKPLMTFQLHIRDIKDIDPEIPVRDNWITSLSEDGDIYENVSLYDLLKDTPGFNLQNVAPSKKHQQIDLFHANTLEWITLDGDAPIYSKNNILITMRHQDSIAIIDWKEKKVLWIWGQGVLSGPHDATMLLNGNLMIFDNGLERKWSRVIELNPLTKKIVWEYHDPEPKQFFTASRGTNQRLPNGNTLITESNDGRAFEITPRGEIVWEFYTPHQNKQKQRANIIRMRRYPVDYIKQILANYDRPIHKP